MEKENKYYLYRHIRLDKNEPFYIGIGTKEYKNPKTHELEYRRAFRKYNRSKHWTNIIKLTAYKVEILFESNDYNIIKNKEIEFIKLYGRKDLDLGTLVNFTDGGDGFHKIITAEQKVRISKSLKEYYSKNTVSQETRKKLSNLHKNNVGSSKTRFKKGDKPKSSKKILDLNTNIEYQSISEYCRIFNIPMTSFCRNINKYNILILENNV